MSEDYRVLHDALEKAMAEVTRELVDEAVVKGMAREVERIALAADVERAKHVVVRTYSQPGNDYRSEVECRCGWKGFADGHGEHVARAVLAAFEGDA